MNSASSVSMSDALDPLVRCNPQASATGPTTAPKPAMASSRGRSERRSAASRPGGWRINNATRAAPAYNSAAVVKAPSPCPNLCTRGVLSPNSPAASKASRPPRSAGADSRVFTVLLPREVGRDEVAGRVARTFQGTTSQPPAQKKSLPCRHSWLCPRPLGPPFPVSRTFRIQRERSGSKPPGRR